ncbi:MAG: hypothetical protein RSD49_17475 [Hafnia sp.]
MTSVLKSSDSVSAVLATMKEKTAERKAFWESPLCERMIADILRSDCGLDCDAPHYTLAQVQASFGWEDLSKETIQLFIDAATDGSASPSEREFAPDSDDDEDDDFACEWACIKRGLHILSLSGQGTVYHIRAATEDEMANSIPSKR